MTAEQVLLLKDAAPFRPFEMFLADGRIMLIPHPDFLTVSEGDQLARVYDLHEGTETIDLMLVVSIRSPVKIAAETTE